MTIHHLTNYSSYLHFTPVAFILGGVVIFKSLTQIKKIQKVKDQVHQKVASASAGHVEIEGIAWPKFLVESDVSGNKVVYLKLTLQEYQRQGKHNRWVTIWEESINRPFYLFDSTGFLLIDPTGADSHCEKKYLVWSKMSDHQKNNFLEKYNGHAHSFPPSNNGLSNLLGTASLFRIVEETIGVGQPVMIQGFLRPDSEFKYIVQDENLKSFKPKITSAIRSTESKKHFFDKNKDGLVSSIEMKNGINHALKTYLKTDLKITEVASSGTNENRIYGIVAQDKSHSLLIYDKFEDQLINENPIYLEWLKIIASVIIMAYALYYIQNYGSLFR